MNYKNPNAPDPAKPYQCRVNHPDRGRISLGWYASPEEVDTARVAFNTEHCPDKMSCRHPEHVAERKVNA